MAATKSPLKLYLARPGSPLVFLDANVLLPVYLRCVFLELADERLIRVHWSEQVLTEVRRNLLHPKFGLSPTQAENLLGDMGSAFPAALIKTTVVSERHFADRINAKDVHVAAGALILDQSSPGHPSILVTSNIKHFPKEAFDGTNILLARPTDFLVELLAARPTVAIVMAKMIERFKKQAVSQEDFLNILDHSGCRSFATVLAARWGFGSSD